MEFGLYTFVENTPASGNAEKGSVSTVGAFN
jgi:hypothetical protein